MRRAGVVLVARSGVGRGFVGRGVGGLSAAVVAAVALALFYRGHLLAVLVDGRKDEGVAVRDDGHGQHEAQRQQVDVVGSVGGCARQVVPRARRQEALRQVARPAEQWRQRHQHAVKPHQNAHLKTDQSRKTVKFLLKHCKIRFVTDCKIFGVLKFNTKFILHIQLVYLLRVSVLL